MKTIQIRKVPGRLQRLLKARAAAAHMSLSDYLLNEFRLIGERPTLEEIQACLATRRAPVLNESPTSILGAERDGR